MAPKNHRNLRRTTGFLLFVGWLFTIWGSGCDLFQLREPEPPAPGGEQWLFPDTPSKVLTNFQNAVNNFNLSLYLRCFDRDQFLFLPEERLLHGPSGDLYQNWDFEVESTRVEQLFQSLDLGHFPSPIILNLTFEVVDSTLEQVRIEATYDLQVYLRESPGEAHARGTSLFTLERDPSSLWSIVQWEDQADSGYLSFAEIKARDFSSGRYRSVGPGGRPGPKSHKGSFQPRSRGREP